MPQATVLVVDDEPSNVVSLQKIFEREDFQVFTATHGRQALDVCREHPVDVVLTDLMMPAMSGLDLIRALRTVAQDTEVVVMTAYGTIEKAVEAMREGAYDFVEKPLRRVPIVKTVRNAAERARLVSENKTLRKELSAFRDRSIVGTSPILRRVLDMARHAAPSSANVLILGQSGTGKELLARHIHEHSQLKGAFVAVNIAALPEGVVESELFGHERGAFTGAAQRRLGRIAQAEGGTLFLDEVGELSPAVQVKLLRVLQEGEYEPLGGRTTRASFRLIAATNRDLEAAVSEGEFRDDLFYRLNVIAITCPRLADRRDDIPLLVEHFVDSYCRKNARTRMEVAEDALARLIDYSWPGNVRELENVIERAVVLSRTHRIEIHDLPEAIARAQAPENDALTFPVGTPLEEIERRVIRETLRHTQGDKRLAAQLLGISTRTIYRKLVA